ncbi:hypothetical protein ABPG72_002025 [Tetrahymena utriculariae]
MINSAIVAFQLMKELNIQVIQQEKLPLYLEDLKKDLPHLMIDMLQKRYDNKYDEEFKEWSESKSNRYNIKNNNNNNNNNNQNISEVNYLKSIEVELSNKGYTFLKKINKGSQGLVVQAKKGNEHYAIKAIKILDYQQNIDQKSVDLVKNEINLAQKCKSQHVIRPIDHFQSKSHYYIVMEECIGTLQDLLDQQSQQNNEVLNENTVIKYAKEILIGMKDCQDNKIVLRDLKPDNILINFQHIAKISDFGLAKQAKDGVSLLSSVNIHGNALYQSPEAQQNQLIEIKNYLVRQFQIKQANKQTLQKSLPLSKQGFKSDCYSVGLILMKMMGMSFMNLFGYKQGISQFDIPYSYSNSNRQKLDQIVKGLTSCFPEDRITIQQALDIFDTIQFNFDNNNQLRNLLIPQTCKKDDCGDKKQYTPTGENNIFIDKIILSQKENIIEYLNQEKEGYKDLYSKYFSKIESIYRDITASLQYSIFGRLDYDFSHVCCGLYEDYNFLIQNFNNGQFANSININSHNCYLLEEYNLEEIKQSKEELDKKIKDGEEVNYIEGLKLTNMYTNFWDTFTLFQDVCCRHVASVFIYDSQKKEIKPHFGQKSIYNIFSLIYPILYRIQFVVFDCPPGRQWMNLKEGGTLYKI